MEIWSGPVGGVESEGGRAQAEGGREGGSEQEGEVER